jgi:hypothetical protein
VDGDGGAMRTGWVTFRRSRLVIVRAYQWTYFIGTLATGILTVDLAFLVYRAVGGGRSPPAFPPRSRGHLLPVQSGLDRALLGEQGMSDSRPDDRLG